MSNLVAPHGGKGLVCCLLEGAELAAETKKAAGLKTLEISDRAKGDLIMMGIGGFSPLNGFMGKADWAGVCEKFLMADGTFWPIPITLDTDDESVKVGDEIALKAADGVVYATMKVTEKFEMTEKDKKWECELVYKGQGEDSADDKFWKVAMEDHPGVQMVMAQGKYNLAGPVKVLSEGDYAKRFPRRLPDPGPDPRRDGENAAGPRSPPSSCATPCTAPTSTWPRSPLKCATGVVIHSLIGNLKPGDIPGNVRIKCIQALIDNYFVPENVINAGYPLDMRYAGPREGLMHATFRQNYGINNMLIGRDPRWRRRLLRPVRGAGYLQAYPVRH